MIPANQDFGKRIQVKSRTLNRDKCTAHFQFPIFAHPSGDSLNALVSKFISDLEYSFVENCKYRASKFSDGDTSDLHLSLVHYYADETILSYCFMITSYYVGAAHGNVEYKTFNYDLSAQQLMRPHDFIQTADSTLRTLIISVLRKEDESCFDEDFVSDIAKDKIQVSIEPDSLVFNFSAYQIVPYACGAPRVKIPRKSLALKLPG